MDNPKPMTEKKDFYGYDGQAKAYSSFRPAYPDLFQSQLLA